MSLCIHKLFNIFGMTRAQIQQRGAFTYQPSESAQIQVHILLILFLYYDIYRAQEGTLLGGKRYLCEIPPRFRRISQQLFRILQSFWEIPHTFFSSTMSLPGLNRYELLYIIYKKILFQLFYLFRYILHFIQTNHAHN